MYLENFIQKEIIIINLYKPLIINKTSITKICGADFRLVSAKRLQNQNCKVD